MNRKFLIVIKLTITAVSFLGAILLKSQIDWTNLTNNCLQWPLIKEILYDLSIGIFASMVLVFFIDGAVETMEFRKSRKKEIDTIKRLNNVILLYIDRYINLFYCVVTPVEVRSHKNICLPVSFTLNDMRDMFCPTGLATENYSKSSVEAFLRVEHEMRELFLHIVETVDFEHYPRIQETLFAFVRFSLVFDAREAILVAPEKDVIIESEEGKNKVPMVDYVREWLAHDADQFFLENKDKTNIRSNKVWEPYIELYALMRNEKKYVLQYINEIKKIEGVW